MKLAVDVMGFENSINEAIKACYEFQKLNQVEIILVGKQDDINKSLVNFKNHKFTVIHANDVIEQNDDITCIRTKKDSSMLKAIQLVVNNQADGVLSAGNSAVYVFLTYQQFGLIPGVLKPGFMPFAPTFSGNGFNIIDVGASIECTAQDLYNFALMANIYTRCRKINKPRIGLLNIGTESHKGFAWHAEADKLLKANKQLNYIGFVEPKAILGAKVDVVLCDGYTGNIFLKTLESSFKTVFSNILKYYKSPAHWLLFPFSAPMLLRMKKKFDYKNHAGAFVLGLNKIAVKTHGSADFKQFYSALRMLKESLDNHILEEIKEIFNHESKRLKE